MAGWSPSPFWETWDWVYRGQSFEGGGGSAHAFALFALQKVWPLMGSTINSLFNKSYSEIEL